jgi:ATP-dependent Clp protease ATP-binding subunit ClpA
MFERFTGDARTVVVHAQEHARRLGHRFIGCEHLLLAVVSGATPAAAVLRDRGLSPEWVEEQIVRRSGLGAGAGLFADLDREALAWIGIDLDVVRNRIESVFGPEALSRAGHDIRCRRHRSRLSPRRALRSVLRRRWSARRRRTLPAAVSVARPVPAIGRYRAKGATQGGHLPFTARAKKVLQDSRHEAVAHGDAHIGAEHITLALLTMRSGMVPPLLAALQMTAPTLRKAILDRYRQAS